MTTQEELPEGVTYEHGEYWSTCPECGAQQADMGNSVKCESCGYGPMPTRSSMPHRTIAYDCVLKRPGCALVQVGMGATIDSYDLQRFPLESWLTAPTPDLRVYPLTPEILERLIKITVDATTWSQEKGP